MPSASCPATTTRARSTLTDVIGLLASAAGRSATFVVGDPDEALGVNDRAQLAGLRDDDAGPDQRRADAVRRDDDRPGHDLDRRDRHGRRRRADRAEHAAARVHLGRRRRGGRPGHDADRCVGRRGRVGGAYARVRRPDRRPGASVGPFAYLRPGTELGRGRRRSARSSRRRTPRSAPASKVPHLTYVGDATIGAHANIGAGDDLRQLRRRQQAPHDDRRRRVRRLGHRRWSRRSRSATARTWRPAARSPRTCRPGRWRSPGRRSATSRAGWPASGPEPSRRRPRRRPNAAEAAMTRRTWRGMTRLPDAPFERRAILLGSSTRGPTASPTRAIGSGRGNEQHRQREPEDADAVLRAGVPGVDRRDRAGARASRRPRRTRTSSPTARSSSATRSRSAARTPSWSSR